MNCFIIEWCIVKIISRLEGTYTWWCAQHYYAHQLCTPQHWYIAWARHIRLRVHIQVNFLCLKQMGETSFKMQGTASHKQTKSGRPIQWHIHFVSLSQIFYCWAYHDQFLYKMQPNTHHGKRRRLHPVLCVLGVQTGLLLMHSVWNTWFLLESQGAAPAASLVPLLADSCEPSTHMHVYFIQHGTLSSNWLTRTDGIQRNHLLHADKTIYTHAVALFRCWLVAMILR